MSNRTEPWPIVDVPPSGFTGCGFVDYSDGRRGELRTDLPSWPARSMQAEQLEVIMRAAGVSLRRGCSDLGMGVVDLSGLRNGHKTMDAAHWEELLQLAQEQWGAEAAEGRELCVCGHPRWRHAKGAASHCCDGSIFGGTSNCRCRRFSDR